MGSGLISWPLSRFPQLAATEMRPDPISDIYDFRFSTSNAPAATLRRAMS
jgi:hypothetical protein